MTGSVLSNNTGVITVLYLKNTKVLFQRKIVMTFYAIWSLLYHAGIYCGSHYLT